MTQPENVNNDPMAAGSERQPAAYQVTVNIPWELHEDLKRLQLRYGGDVGKLNASRVKMIMLDALCRELHEQGYYGSGATMWYGSPIQRVRPK